MTLHYILAPLAPYRSPTLWFEGRPGIDSDLWALGTTIFTLRAGFELISNPFLDLGPSGSIRHIIQYLGPLPDHWDKLYFDMYGTAQSRDEITPDLQQVYSQEDQEELLLPWDRTPEHPLATLGSFICDDYHGPIRPEDEEDKEAAAKYGQEWDPNSAMVKIPAEEAEPFSVMLQRLMCYEAKDQTPAASLREHAWLIGQFPVNTPASDAPPLFQSTHLALR